MSMSARSLPVHTTGLLVLACLVACPPPADDPEATAGSTGTVTTTMNVVVLCASADRNSLRYGGDASRRKCLKPANSVRVNAFQSYML